ncbi:hypothetical protein K439DRAFT_1638287 [Ramaria rubella]|nr:hypothetical protein K439DRAFT_1638287 [Ramaria rubella]
MSSPRNNLNLPLSWSFDVQNDGQDLCIQEVDYHELNVQYIDRAPLDSLDVHDQHCSTWPTSPFYSPIGSDYSTESAPDESMYYSTVPYEMQSGFQSLPSPDDRSSRAYSSSPVLTYSRTGRSYTSEQAIHETYEVETGEEEAVKRIIHRLTDEEKRGLNLSSINRPNFLCRVDGCGQWLLHRAQVKPHLSAHGITFPKPYGCTCGAEFGRQVEAARHVEDKKLCEQCHRSGRKHKGGVICVRCLRRLGGN